MKSFILEFGTTIASLALAVVTLDANSSCIFVHQPKLPEEAKKLRRF